MRAALPVMLLLLCTACGGLGLGRTEDELSDEFSGPLASASGELNVSYVTPRSMTWSWDATALGSDVQGYMLHYGADEQEVRARRGSIWGVTDDPNLAWAFSPFGPDLVHRTTVTKLLPYTEQFALLWVLQGSGATVAVAEGFGRTALWAGDHVTIFKENEHTPPTVTLTGFDQDPSAAGNANTGVNALWIDTSAAAGWINGRIAGLGLDVSGIPAAAWQEALFELHVAISEAQGRAIPVYYIELTLVTEADSYTYGLPEYAVLPARPGWHLIEVPLAQFLSIAQVSLTDAGRPAIIDDFRIGAAWPPTGRVWVDDVVIRY